MKCCICGKEFEGYGNDPWPIALEGRCCDECNFGPVLGARIAGAKAKRQEALEQLTPKANRKYYFTYGSDPKMPFEGGWTEIEAPDEIIARKLFRAVHPDQKDENGKPSGFLNCAGVYTEEEFKRTKMFTNGNLCAFRRERITLQIEATK